MSLTRLAGAWSSAAFLEKSTLPSASRSRTASALRAGARPFCAQAGAAASQSITLKARMKRTAVNLTRGRAPVKREKLPDRSLQLLGRLEPRCPASRHVHGLPRPRVLALARFAPAHRE